MISRDCKIAEDTGRRWKAQYLKSGIYAKRRLCPRYKVIGEPFSDTACLQKPGGKRIFFLSVDVVNSCSSTIKPVPHARLIYQQSCLDQTILQSHQSAWRDTLDFTGLCKLVYSHPSYAGTHYQVYHERSEIHADLSQHYMIKGNIVDCCWSPLLSWQAVATDPRERIVELLEVGNENGKQGLARPNVLHTRNFILRRYEVSSLRHGMVNWMAQYYQYHQWTQQIVLPLRSIPNPWIAELLFFCSWSDAAV
ncbi:hypothetical protein BJ878DRAFT_296011 [Calycina marina]|uniref:Uncharacterized protein n=1 Tax=Calycina marina TaxID=1763456 RepID=A0A9P8CAZ3_9HELO|nr:hypothetical protein BJ878DRAFT_296011 [Calycina marina]